MPDRAALIRMGLRAGYSDRQIARAFGYSRRGIHHVYRALGIDPQAEREVWRA